MFIFKYNQYNTKYFLNVYKKHRKSGRSSQRIENKNI